MLAQWIGDLVGKMHIYGITSKELSDQLGYNPKYVSTVLNGKRAPKNAQETFTNALDLIIEDKVRRGSL